MKRCMIKTKEAAGYVLISVLFLTMLATILVVGMLEASMSNATTVFVSSRNNKHFYDVERTINTVVAWLQSNSKNIVGAFNSSNFNSQFDRTAPTIGDNQGSGFAVPTMIKMKGTNHAVQLTNNAFFGESYFPVTTNIDTGVPFNAVDAFEVENFGSVNVRILLVWAKEAYHDIDAYQPLFRVDAVTGTDPEKGVHGVNFIGSELSTSNSNVGFFGNTVFSTNSGNNTCYSYIYTWNASLNSYLRGSATSLCRIYSNGALTLGGKVFGDVATNLSGGLSFVRQGAVSGNALVGPGSHGYSLPILQQFSETCPGAESSYPDITVNSNMTLAPGCYRNVHINSNRTLTIATPNIPYNIKNLTFQNNSNARMAFQVVAPGNKYILNVHNFNGGQFNGNNTLATNLDPCALEFNITNPAAHTLTLNGTAVINGVITTSAAATVSVLGNFNFYGAIRSGNVAITGNATIGDAKCGGGPTLNGINFSLTKASQRYR